MLYFVRWLVSPATLEFLVASTHYGAMGTRSDDDWLLRDKYKGHQSAAFMADRARLATGEPLGYVIGWVPFLDCAIWLKTRPLIPRPETEFWVARAIAQMRKDEIVKPRVLDLCAGSGCVEAPSAQNALRALLLLMGGIESYRFCAAFG